MTSLQAEMSHARASLKLAESVAVRTTDVTPEALFTTACGGLVEVLGAERCSIVSEGIDGKLAFRRTEAAPGLPSARLASPVELSRRLDLDRASGPPGVRVLHERAVACEGGGERAVSLLVAPIGERALLVLEGDPAWCTTDEDVSLVRTVAALLVASSRDAARRREELQHVATANAMRRLLETGVSARSAIEAARALASTAAYVLGFPVGCAYLVGESGVITDAVTVGADPRDAERLRVSLVGQLASGSPVWRRTLLGPGAGPDLIEDTAAAGVVRRGGVAEVLGLRSMAAIPLLSSEGPLGLVLCGGHSPRQRWHRGDRELLTQLSLAGAIVVDNARLRASERYEASHDALTGLFNRRAFSNRLESALVASATTGEQVAVLLMDLDRFKEVNDFLGHQWGDELLVAVGNRLRGGLGATDVLARIGGDEFAALVPIGGTIHRAEALASTLGAMLEEPFDISDSLLSVDVSIGISCCPADGSDAVSLVQRADAAMYEAKRSGRGYVAFGPGVAARTAAELGLLGELRRTLNDGQGLVLQYQPKVNLATGAVSGVEALVRWEHPRRGLLGPDQFVPMAEETGLVRALTGWMLPEALAEMRRWRDRGLDLAVSVNVSARDIADRLFPERVTEWLRCAGVPGSSLVIEVTEATMMDDRLETTVVLQSLRALGVRVSLDDFGTGYSSFAYLETLPVDEVKIDRQFLHLGRSRGSVIRSIVSLGHELEMTVVAEGVESEEHLRWLAEIGCDEAQGYYLSLPLSPAELERWACARGVANRASRVGRPLATSRQGGAPTGSVTA